MKRVLVCTGWLDVSGTETFIMNVLKNVDPDKIHIDFLLNVKKDTRYSREAESLGSTLYYVPPRREGLIRYFKALDGFFATVGKDYDVVHYCGGSLTSIACLKYAAKYKVPIRIAHAHSSTNDGLHNKIFHWLNKRFAQRYFTHCWACSSDAGEYFFGNRPHEIIHNGIDTKAFRFSEEGRELTRKELSIPSDALVLGHIGRFVPVKNQSFVVDIFNELQRREPNSRLVLVGVGPEMENIQGKVKSLGLEDKVVFTGERSEIPNLLWAMDYFVMPSIYEGQPFVLVEAQAAGVRCLAADSISADSKITDGLEFLSLKASPLTWTEYILDWNKKRNLRDFCEQVIHNGFDIIDTVKQIEKNYLSN